VQAWKELGIDLDVGFNVSPRQFWQPDFAERILAQVNAAHIDPAKVLVEITETSAMLDPDRAQQILAQLHAGGLSIAIDDFGTGYSSLAYLGRLPIGAVKIDGTFVRSMLSDPSSLAIVGATVGLAHALGFQVVAEGVDSQAVLDRLGVIGADLAQGYHIARPMSANDLAPWLEGQARRSR